MEDLISVPPSKPECEWSLFNFVSCDFDILATGPGNLSAVLVWTGKTVWFGLTPVHQPDMVLLGMVSPGQDIEPWVVGNVGIEPWFQLSCCYSFGCNKVFELQSYHDMMNTQIVPCCQHFHLQHSDLRSDWYSLSGCEIRAISKPNSRVFDSNSRSVSQIANLKAGGERAAKTAQSMYWSCPDMIRTQILNGWQSFEVEMLGSWW